VGLVLMLAIRLVPIWFWRSVSGLAYVCALGLLIMVELFGTVGMGAQRWIDLGFIQFQPSEMMKIALVMSLAAYYDWLPLSSVSRPQWVLVPLILILVPATIIFRQPDLGTTVLLVVGSGIVMFCAGVSWWYFLGVIGAAAGMVFTVFLSRGTDWQILQDYQYRRISIFLDPSSDPLGAGYHTIQSVIAIGS
ncbi:MAG: FtsW/RodA/SpoVE family cell cycle protein, partial [Boseongicola sp.]|nr:FtsW/RodA/SpoVE family cell cycle protein [Boseongicola sp.]